jgi:hypothetical protein
MHTFSPGSNETATKATKNASTPFCAKPCWGRTPNRLRKAATFSYLSQFVSAALWTDINP